MRRALRIGRKEHDSQSIENTRGSSERWSPESVYYDKLLRGNRPPSSRKSRKTVVVESRVCYGKLLRDLPRGVLQRGQKPYYRHTVPVDAQRLLNRLEIWRSLRTDSLAVAVRRLPSVVGRIEMEIEHARAMVGRCDAHPEDLAERPIPVALRPSPASSPIARSRPRRHIAATSVEDHGQRPVDPGPSNPHRLRAARLRRGKTQNGREKAVRRYRGGLYRLAPGRVQ